jgi:cyclomaltodextrinase / maltogenic alpha-amylase / neopullulanase
VEVDYLGEFMLTKKLHWLILILILGLVTACATGGEQPARENAIPEDITAATVTPTAQPTATSPPPTEIPTITPTPTPTKIPDFYGKKENYPIVNIVSTIDGYAGTLEVMPVSDSGAIMIYQWFQDETNPELLVLSTTEGSQINVTIPQTPGEYFINVTVQDENRNSYTARRLITVTDDEVYVNTVDHHAEWINHITMYEINTFDWDRSSQDRFVGITRYLDNLVDLGINTIWFTPVFEGDCLGYCTKDYYKINSWLGSEDNFKRMVDMAHAKGIRIVLDLVFNHTWIEHPFMQDVLENKSASPYADWYQWTGVPGESAHRYYYDWVDGPNVNVDNPEVQEYFTQVAEYWVIKYDIDGYRCDVAWGVEQDSTTFWPNLARRLKNIKPEIFLLAEAPAAGGRWEFTASTEHDKSILFDDRFAAAYDWDLRPWEENKGIIGSLTGWRSIGQLNAILTDEYPARALPLRFIENHDLSRAASILDIPRAKLGHTIIFTIPGVPLIYGGAEHAQPERMEGIMITDPNGTEAYFTQLINARKDYIDSESAMAVLPNTNATKVNSYATISAHSIAISSLNFSAQPQEVIIDLTTFQEQLAAYPYLVDVFETGKSILADDFNALVATLEPYEASVIIFTDIEGGVAAQSGQPADSSSATDPVNLLLNGDFSDGFDGWLSYIHAGSGAAAEFNPVAGALQVEIASKGSENWHIQLLQSLIELAHGETYVVEFTASAEKSRSINVAFTRDGGDFATYANQSISLSTAPKTYEFSFTMTAATDNAPRFVIDLGDSGNDVTFDNFVLYQE